MRAFWGEGELFLDLYQIPFFHAVTCVSTLHLRLLTPWLDRLYALYFLKPCIKSTYLALASIKMDQALTHETCAALVTWKNKTRLQCLQT